MIYRCNWRCCTSTLPGCGPVPAISAVPIIPDLICCLLIFPAATAYGGLWAEIEKHLGQTA